MSDPEIEVVVVPRELFYHEAAYVRGLEKRVEKLSEALRRLIDNVETGSYESTGQATAEARAALAPRAGQMSDPLKTYTVTIRQHELNALFDVVTYLRSLAQIFPDHQSDAFAAKMQAYAQMFEDMAGRAEPESMPKQALNHIEAHMKSKP